MGKFTPADAERLSTFLLSLDEEAMVPSELDGFLAGIVICPEPILPSEWLPCIWGNAGQPFEGAAQAEDIIALIMARYNDIARTLQRRGRFSPILEPDIDDTFLWEIWAEGFAQAVGLRMNECWDTYEQCEDEAVRAAMGFLSMLAGHALSGEPLDRELDEDVRAQSDTYIAHCLETLCQARLGTQARPAGPDVASVGRNDPCPCGSGRKFKKCCLN